MASDIGVDCHRAATKRNVNLSHNLHFEKYPDHWEYFIAKKFDVKSAIKHNLLLDKFWVYLVVRTFISFFFIL